VCRVSISVQVASRVSQLPLRGAAVSNQGQNRPSKHQKVSLTPLLVGFINGINQIENWFSILQGNSLKDASFTSVKQLREHIDAFIEAYNENAKAFAWTKSQVYQKRLKARFADQ
jgi:hypothetical protein